MEDQPRRRSRGGGGWRRRATRASRGITMSRGHVEDSQPLFIRKDSASKFTFRELRNLYSHETARDCSSKILLELADSNFLNIPRNTKILHIRLKEENERTSFLQKKKKRKNTKRKCKVKIDAKSFVKRRVFCFLSYK